MASSLFRPSRIISVALVIGAGLWIASGSFGPVAEETDEEPATAAEFVIPVQTVGVAMVSAEARNRQIILSCVTRAENRAKAVARGAGVIVELSINRGDRVRAGDVVAVISDEGRQANVSQATALLQQRLAEFDANKILIDRGDAPRNRLPALEAAVAAARAAVAIAQAEADRSSVRSPIDGTVDTVPILVGQAVQVGTVVADIVDPDPMLAVGAVSENRRASLRPGQAATVRFIDGGTVDGTVHFVGLSADTATRTYPVEAAIANAEALIADGVTCEMAVSLPPVQAAAVPRSALVFSDDGLLGVRIADDSSHVQFVPIDIVDDGRKDVWVTGIEGTVRVIVVGQDFVQDGDLIEAGSAAAAGLGEEPPA